MLVINRKFVQMARGEIDRLMIFAPPQHGKSELTSQYLTSWWLGMHPDDNIILASYAAEYASLWGRKARDVLEQWGPELFNVHVDRRSSAANAWSLRGRKGGMVSVGVRGPITGGGAELAIIDDPIKNNQEANSRTHREAIRDGYKSTFLTRVRKGGKIVHIMTRWHEDDLAGRLIDEMKNGKGDQWDIVELPALGRKPGSLDVLGRKYVDPLGRREGEALCPQLFDEELLNRRKAILGSYWWSALYDQKPSADGGTLFKRSDFRYFYDDGLGFYVLVTPDGEKRIDKAQCWIFQTVDTAATERETSDWFVCATWAATPNKELLLLDVFRERAETTKHEQIMASQRAKWNPVFQGVEAKTYGLNIIQSLRRQGHPVRPLQADRDKVSRARIIAARYENGFVYHLRGASWLDEYEKELTAFPTGEHDDQVDAAAYAGITIMLDMPTPLETGT